MSTTKTKDAPTLSRWVLGCAVVITVLIAIAAFILSFAALTDLARMSGIPAHLAWLWPLIVDGLIVAGTIATVAMSAHERRARAYPWAVLAGSALVSVSANAAHAVVNPAASAVPAVIAAAVASAAPIALLVVTHLTVVLTKRTTPKKPAQRSSKAQAPMSVAPSAPPAQLPADAPVTLHALPTPAAGLITPSQDVVDLDTAALAEWVAAQESDGTRVTGTQVGELLGLSAASGRRRLAQVRELLEESA